MAEAAPVTDWPTRSRGTKQVQGGWRSPGYRSGARRARWALLAVGLATAGYGAQAVVAAVGLPVTAAARAGTLSVEQSSTYAAATSVVGVVAIVTFVPSVIAFLAWFSRWVENVPPLTGQVPRRSPRTAIGTWFLPIANLGLPYAITRDTLDRLDPDRRSAASRLVAAWWLTWLSANMLASFASGMSRTAQTPDGVQTAAVLTLVAMLLATVNGVCALGMIASANALSRSRAAALGLGDAVGPTWPRAAGAVRVDDAEPVGTQPVE